MTIEQMCRDLLQQAIKDGVAGSSFLRIDPDPQMLTTQELIGMADMLEAYFRYHSRNAMTPLREKKEPSHA
jgi:hypothetical protein